jgi:uncharacterized protein YeaO (DUF488 family)
MDSAFLHKKFGIVKKQKSNLPKTRLLCEARMIKIKRVYDPPAKEDGYRILIDRLWPRGLTKERAKIDLWLKEIAPSNELRKWFNHDPEKWEEFKAKYEKELTNKQNLLHEIKQLEKEKGIVTLLYSTKETEHNNAVALNGFLKE